MGLGRRSRRSSVEGLDALGDDDDEGGSDKDAHADCRDQAELGLGEGEGEREGAGEEGAFWVPWLANRARMMMTMLSRD